MTAIKKVLTGTWTLAKTLADEFMKAGSKADKLKVIQKAKDSKVNKEFSEIKSGMMKKVAEGKPKKNIIPSRDTSMAKEWAADKAKRLSRIANKRKRMESVGGYNRARQEAKDAGTPYGMKKGGAISKRPMGGKVYKVDNSGQQMVAKQYGGKVK
jgi:hypothetical protein